MNGGVGDSCKLGGPDGGNALCLTSDIRCAYEIQLPIPRKDGVSFVVSIDFLNRELR